MPRILVDLIDDLRPAVLGNPSGNTLSGFDLHLLDPVGLAADGCAKGQVACVLVSQQNRCRFCIGCPHGTGEHACQQIVQLHRARGHLSDFEEHVELADLLFELLFGFEELGDREVALVLVQHLHHPDGPAVLILHRDAKGRAGPKPRPAVPFSVKTDVLVGVFDVQWLARPGHGASQTLAWAEADLVNFFALNDLRPKLVGLLVQKVERGSIGLHDFADPVEDHLEQLAEVEGGSEGRADVLERPELGPLPLDHVLEP